jgi:hypothetical protein
MGITVVPRSCLLRIQRPSRWENKNGCVCVRECVETKRNWRETTPAAVKGASDHRPLLPVRRWTDIHTYCTHILSRVYYIGCVPLFDWRHLIPSHPSIQETPIGEVIEGMEHVEQFYSYGDMPPWGKGPVQGKIHGHPSYITENFPKTDRFLTCKVERLRETSEKGVNAVLMKEDGTTDEEAFQKARHEMEEKERDLKNAAAAAAPHEERPILEELGKVREKLNVPYIRKQLGRERDNDAMLVYFGMGAMVVLMAILFAMRRGKKVASKSN